MAANNIFGSDGSSALPGGNVAKPLIIALLALFASRYFGKKGADQTASAEPQPAAIEDVLAAIGGHPVHFDIMVPEWFDRVFSSSVPV